eukprot:g35317.t1
MSSEESEGELKWFATGRCSRLSRTERSDFNQVNLKNVPPKYHQHTSCPTRGPNILHHCYTTIKDAYRSTSHLHFGKSDHNAVLLLLAYNQKLKCEDPVQKVVEWWSEETKGPLRDCLELVEWSIFKNSVANLNEHATTVTDFISKCVDEYVNLILFSSYVVSSNMYNDLLLVPLPFENFLHFLRDILDPGTREA